MATFVVGILVVGVGTSVPELVSSLYAAYADVTEIVIGNVLGSNITNILLVLGIAGLLGKVTRLKRDMLHIDLPMVLGSAILLGFLIIDGYFTRMDAVLCLMGTALSRQTQPLTMYRTKVSSLLPGCGFACSAHWGLSCSVQSSP